MPRSKRSWQNYPNLQQQGKEEVYILPDYGSGTMPVQDGVLFVVSPRFQAQRPDAGEIIEHLLPDLTSIAPDASALTEREK
jgi:hypothetical protein